jgi:thioesterase domain-containing protein
VEAYLHEHIPLSAAMGVRVLQADGEGVRLEAPLRANLNHRATAFGGSVSALAILAGWTLVHRHLRERGLSVHTVIHRSEVHYDRPISGDFQARTLPVAPEAWERLVRALERRGKGRVRVAVVIESDGAQACTFEGSYVALRPRSGDRPTPVMGGPPPAP